jgi:hypothetical protein
VEVATAKLETALHCQRYLMVLLIPEAEAAHQQELPLLAVRALHSLQELAAQELL